MAVHKKLWEVSVEISLGVPLVANECKEVLHCVDVDLDDDELNEGLKAGGASCRVCEETEY